MTCFSSRRLRPLVVSVLLGIAVYIGGVFLTDLAAVWCSAGRVDAYVWCGVLGLSLLNYALRFARWQAYLRRLGHWVPLIPGGAYYVGGFAFTTTPAKAGEALRSVYLKRHGVGYADSLAALFAERFVDVIAMIVLALTAVSLYPDARWVLAMLGGFSLLVFITLHRDAARRYLARIGTQTRHVRLRLAVSGLFELLKAAAVLLRGQVLVVGTLIGILAWTAEGVGLHLILTALDMPVSMLASIGIYALSVLVGALSMIPGGLGSTEAAMGLLLIWQGADAPSAVAATLICRIATLWFAVLLGMVSVLGLELTGKGTQTREVDPC